MLYTEAIFNIRERLRQTIDDSNIDDREIIFELNNQRALYYRNEYNKNNRVIDEEIKQTLCVSLEETTEDGCCGELECTILRSTLPVPNTIEFHHKNALLRISNTEFGSKPFSLVSYNQFPFVGNSKYNSKEIFVAKHNNGYLYFKSSNKLHKFLSKVMVTVILENPLDVEDFLDCNGDDCFNLETFEYPIKGYVFAYMVDKVVNNFIAKLNIPEDKLNDAESQ